MLKGYKTYLLGLLALIDLVLIWTGVIDVELGNKILELFGVGIVFTLRDAIQSKK